MQSKCLLVATAIAVTFAARAAEPPCSSRSGPRTTALVELYTSEGCDSCPAADHWLSSLFAQGFRPDQVVPLALHVDYWDYIGWKDPFAKGEFSLRQRKLAQLKRPVIVYTPQVLLQGRDFPRWSSCIRRRAATAALPPTTGSLRSSPRASGPIRWCRLRSTSTIGTTSAGRTRLRRGSFPCGSASSPS